MENVKLHFSSMQINWINIFRAFIASILVALFFGLFCGCKTLPPPIPTTSRDSTHTRIETRVDTLWRDRWHTEKQRGDTIFIRDSIYLEKIKYRDRVDSVTVSDSIPYPVEVPVRVRNGYDKFTARGFWVFIGISLLYIAWLLFKSKIRAFLGV